MKTYSQSLDEAMLLTDDLAPGSSFFEERSFGQRLTAVIALHRLGVSGARLALQDERTALFQAVDTALDHHMVESGQHAVELILGNYERTIFEMAGLDRIVIGGHVDGAVGERKSYFNGIPIKWSWHDTLLRTR